MFRIGIVLATAAAALYARKQRPKQSGGEGTRPISTATEEAEVRGAEAAAAENKRQAEEATERDPETP